MGVVECSDYPLTYTHWEFLRVLPETGEQYADIAKWRLHNFAYGKCLTAKGDGEGNGTPLVLRSCGQAGQFFNIHNTPYQSFFEAPN